MLNQFHSDQTKNNVYFDYVLHDAIIVFREMIGAFLK